MGPRTEKEWLIFFLPIDNTILRGSAWDLLLLVMYFLLRHILPCRFLCALLPAHFVIFLTIWDSGLFTPVRVLVNSALRLYIFRVDVAVGIPPATDLIHTMACSRGLCHSLVVHDEWMV